MITIIDESGPDGLHEQGGETLALPGDLQVPPGARAIVLFAHGTGSSRHSSRNRHVAAVLREAAFATLLFDLLTLDEEHLDRQTAELRFDINLLASRLTGATEWVLQNPETRDLKIGYFGASTGAAAALVAAAKGSFQVGAIVSRGGRPDLAGTALSRITSPTLLIVGGHDLTVLDLNRSAQSRLVAPNKIEIVPGATHLFEEPGALDEVARLAVDWFTRYL